MSLAFATTIDCGAGFAGPVERSPDVRSPDVRSFGYDAAEDTKRRRLPAATIRSEDQELPAQRRRKLQANANDIQRNFSIAAWAIRKHLDFVTNFAFSSNNAESAMGTDGSPAALRKRSQLDDDIEGIIAEASAASVCDAAGRHDLATMLRLCEARATVTGDHGFIELADGSLQAIESDRIRDPSGVSYLHGVQVDARGRAVAYAVHQRTLGGGYQLERWVPAENFILRGYFDRFDQVRGISPLAPALNTLRDLYEGFDYALAKAKLSQLFGFKSFRSADDSFGTVSNDGTDDAPKYSVDLGAGPWNLDLDPGDQFEIMESKTPSVEFQTYSEMMIAVSLLALDLPWNFFKVDATNFFGSRAALNLYLQSVKPKRVANRAILNRWTRRQLQLAVLRGRLKVPRGITIDSLKWAWTPDGLPWWNPTQEADGALKSIGAGLDNPQRVALETGTNFYENIDRIAEAKAYAESKGVPLSFAVAGGIMLQQN